LIKVMKFFCLLVLFAAPLFSFSQVYKGGKVPIRASNQNDVYTPKDSLTLSSTPADSAKKKAIVVKKDSLNNTSNQNYIYTHQDSLSLSLTPTDSSKKKAIVIKKDSLNNDEDTLRMDWQGGDSTFKDRKPSDIKDTTARKLTDTLKIEGSPKKEKKDIETTIKYTAADSITMDMTSKTAYLYNDSKIDYGTMNLKAEQVDIDWGHNLVTARGLPDSTGKLIGRPVMKEKSQTVQAEVIKFNFKTKKGIISKIVTKQGDGYVHGDKVKRDAEGAMYINSAKYTTCDLPHPHFYIQATKLKMLPNDKIVSGPFHFVVGDVPTPLGFFLGYFPLPKKKKSGIIFPTIGENATRGFYLSQAGYYWAPNDYMGIKFLADIYSNGSFRGNIVNTYKKRYCFTGSFNLSYGQLSPNFEGTDKTALFNVIWTHNSVVKRGRSFNASVNITSNKNYAISSYNPTAVMSNDFISSIGYTKAFQGTPFNVSITARQDENVRTKTMNLTLPQVALNMNRIYPFKKAINSKGAWYEKISISYTGNSQFSTTTLPVNNTAPTGSNVVSPELALDTLNPNPLKTPINTILRGFASRGQFGVKHTIPISTTISLFKVFNMSPSATYDEYWYLKRTNYNYRDTSLYVTNQQGFYRAYDYNISNSVTTSVYGMFHFKSQTLQAIRHTLRPTVGFVYHPDFANTQTFGNDEQVQTSKTNSEKVALPHFTQTYPGSPGAGQAKEITFSLVNTLEAKVKSAKDTSHAVKKINLLNNFGISGNYNFKASAFKLSTLSLIATTTLFGRINVNYNSVLDPYYYVGVFDQEGSLVSQRRVDTLAISATKDIQDVNNLAEGYTKSIQSKGLFHVTSTTLSLSGNVNPKGQKNAPAGLGQTQNQAVAPVVPQSNVNYGNPNLYMDFNIPWNLFVSFNYNSSKQGYEAASVTKSLTFNGDLKISSKWKIAVTSGYDIVHKAATMTTISINRDLHCWQMTFYVIPFGPSQTYTFTLVAKSSMLHDLKLTKRSSGYISQPD